MSSKAIVAGFVFSGSICNSFNGCITAMIALHSFVHSSYELTSHTNYQNTNLISDSLISLRAAMLLLTSSRSLIPRARRLLRLSMNRKISSMSPLACQMQQKQSFNATHNSRSTVHYTYIPPLPTPIFTVAFSFILLPFSIILTYFC